MATRWLHCDECAQMRDYEQPPCLDGHGSECPEWACTGCGAAVLLSPAILLMDRRPRVLLQTNNDERAETHRRRAA
jgi:hypothetical protein